MSIRLLLHRVLRWSGPLLLGFCGLWKLVEWQTEWLWFASAGYGAQFGKLMAWRTGSFALGAAAFAIWLGLNAHLAWKNAARSHFPLTFFEKNEGARLIPLEDKLHLDRFRRPFTIFTVALFSWLAGLSCAVRYATFLRAFYGLGTGQFDAASGFDLSFFLFQLPLWHLLSRLSLAAIVLALLIVAAIYAYEETLGLGRQAPRLVRSTSVHLAILWALLLLWRGAACVLSVPEGFVSSGNVATRVFDGVDIRFGWTAALGFALSAPFLAFLSGLAIAQRPRPRPFLLGLAWFACAGNVPFLLPLVVGHSPQNPAWREAVERHLGSTRRAWALDDLTRKSLPGGATATSRPLRFRALSDAGALSNLSAPSDQKAASPLPLWPAVAAQAAMNARLSAQRVGGSVGRVWLERQRNSLHFFGIAAPILGAGEDWTARHSLVGPGQFLDMDATRAGRDGAPIFAPNQALTWQFGLGNELLEPDERNGGWQRRARTPAALEADRSTAAAWVLDAATLSNAPEEADGSVDDSVQGVSLADFPARWLLSARFFDWQLAREPLARGRKVLWHRGAGERCAQIAPFLDWPASEARPVLRRDGNVSHLCWLVPGLVWSDDYPDSATPAAPGTAPDGANYGRQVAVGVVDGKTGAVSLFSLDEDEPFLALYRRAFPGLFAPLSSLPNPLLAALAPSPRLLQAQSLIWSRYHQRDAPAWVSRQGDLRPTLPFWPGEDEAFRAAAHSAAGDWRFLPLSSAVGEAEATGRAAPLIAILGADETNFAAQKGRVKWTQWRADKPLLLPDEVAPPAQKVVANRLIDPPPTLISIAPHLDASGHVQSLWIARGQTNSPETAAGETAAETDAIGAAPRLSTNFWLMGEAPRLRALPQPVSPLRTPVQSAQTATRATTRSDALESAQRAWDDLLKARRGGDWKGVARAEKRLDAALKKP